jgi:hypothetical protein
LAQEPRPWRIPQRFAENGVDLAALRDLAEDDFKELGVLLRHRRKLMRDRRAEASLRASREAASRPPVNQ